MTPRPCKIVGDVCHVPLTQGQTAIVDAAAYGRVSQFNWYAHLRDGHFYAERAVRRSGRRIGVRLHSFILKTSQGEIVDHANGDTLDNRKSNLRTCAVWQNTCNQRKRSGTSSKFKGVCRAKRGRGWTASVCIAKKKLHLGSFGCEIDAARAYDRGALEHFGEFARPNFPNAERDAS